MRSAASDSCATYLRMTKEFKTHCVDSDLVHFTEGFLCLVRQLSEIATVEHLVGVRNRRNRRKSTYDTQRDGRNKCKHQGGKSRRNIKHRANWNEGKL